MKIYFEETNGNNLVIITDGKTAKIFDAAFRLKNNPGAIRGIFCLNIKLIFFIKL